MSRPKKLTKDVLKRLYDQGYSDVDVVARLDVDLSGVRTRCVQHGLTQGKGLSPKDEPKTYIALDDLEFGWSDLDVATFDALWLDGLHISDISDQLRRNDTEVACLALDRALKGKINPRKKGVLGI